MLSRSGVALGWGTAVTLCFYVPPLHLFLRLGREQQWVSHTPTGISPVRRLGFRHVLSEDSDNARAAPMGGHHHSQSLILAHVKFYLQDRDDEIAGRKVVIDQNDFVETRAFDLYLILGIGFGDDVSHLRHRSS
jgi:hypothetical protein